MYIGSGYIWATHQPLLSAAMDLYKPGFVLELGPGDYSTPLFLDYDCKLMCVENDREWVSYLIKKYNIDILHHDLGSISNQVLYSELEEKQKEDIARFYKKLQLPDTKPNLLFVDQWASCRVLSINTLGKEFDIIIYHDCDRQGTINNSYDLIDLEGYNTYFLDTLGTATGLKIKKELFMGFDPLNAVVKNYTEKFKEKNKDCIYMAFYGVGNR